MRITKWGEYAILFCVYLASRGKDMPPAGATEIGGAYNIPTQYAQQILHRLRKGSIIKSVRGPHGGFQLLHTPEETNLKQILHAAEGTTFEIICEGSSSLDSDGIAASPCSLRAIWMDLKKSVDQILEETSLSELATKAETIGRCRGGDLVASIRKGRGKNPATKSRKGSELISSESEIPEIV